jgi:hypothetical protein
VSARVEFGAAGVNAATAKMTTTRHEAYLIAPPGEPGPFLVKIAESAEYPTEIPGGAGAQRFLGGATLIQKQAVKEKAPKRGLP